MSRDERKEYFDHRLEKHSQNLRTSSSDHVAEMLSVIAATIGCELPPVVVLAKYIDMLMEFPPDLIDIAGHAVLRRHKWNNFPRVAEFIEHIEELYQERQENLRHTQLTMKAYGVSAPAVARGPLRGQGPRSLGESLPNLKKE
jgi:hypothetical protein